MKKKGEKLPTDGLHRALGTHTRLPTSPRLLAVGRGETDGTEAVGVGVGVGRGGGGGRCHLASCLRLWQTAQRFLGQSPRTQDAICDRR